MGRLIDADALKELFSEVIGSIAKKPEMNGNLEHMIRASAMVIQMIDDAPTVQPDTTAHDSIPAETGKNDGDRTSGDLISRQAVLNATSTTLRITGKENAETVYGYIKKLCDDIKALPSVQPERKKGKWHRRFYPQIEMMVCSECQEEFSYDAETGIRDYNYCPNCGADMRGEKNG